MILPHPPKSTLFPYTTLFRSDKKEEPDLERPHPRHGARQKEVRDTDRKSTRLNSSHPSISYAVFCLKKKKPYYQYHENSNAKQWDYHKTPLIGRQRTSECQQR